MEVNAFEILASIPDDPDTGRFFAQSRYLKLEIPPNAEGCRRFLHGVAVKETFTGDVVMEDCVEMTTSSVLRYCGIVKVSRACILKYIYPEDFFVSKYNTKEP
ncbi:uncharacterized protein LOC108160780 [Drosophila miranda]|uniref:uncharacterized protein LOC108160780 n=1 Tax=Drosophila miranda TaxID=7229 RepID=UPI0007E5C0D5|nr:uncharacterized protein LOC108160780 [Drosophila miranda]XP_033248167.1 uncharacterized protein LOC108160780 [Drosophila miranda]